MLTKEDKLKIIDWITCGGQSKAILEGGDIDGEDTTSNEIEDFIAQCHGVLKVLLRLTL